MPRVLISNVSRDNWPRAEEAGPCESVAETGVGSLQKTVASAKPDLESAQQRKEESAEVSLSGSLEETAEGSVDGTRGEDDKEEESAEDGARWKWTCHHAALDDLSTLQGGKDLQDVGLGSQSEALLGVWSSIVQDATDVEAAETECEDEGLASEEEAKSVFLNSSVAWILSADAQVEQSAEGEADSDVSLFTFPDSGSSYKALGKKQSSRGGREEAWKVVPFSKCPVSFQNQQTAFLAVKKVSFNGRRGLPGWLLRSIAWTQQIKAEETTLSETADHKQKEGPSEDAERRRECSSQILLSIDEIHVGVDKAFFLLHPGRHSISLGMAVLHFETARATLSSLCSCALFSKVEKSSSLSELCVLCNPRLFGWKVLCALEKMKRLRLSPHAFSPASVYLRSVSIQGTDVAALSVALSPAAPECTPPTSPEFFLWTEEEEEEGKEEGEGENLSASTSLLPDSAWVAPELAAEELAPQETFVSPLEAREASTSWGVGLSLISLFLLRREFQRLARPKEEKSAASFCQEEGSVKRSDSAIWNRRKSSSQEGFGALSRRNSRRLSSCASVVDVSFPSSQPPFQEAPREASSFLSAAQRRRRSCGLPEGLELFPEEEEEEENCVSRNGGICRVASDAARSTAAGDCRLLSQSLADAAASSISFLQYDSSGHLKTEALLNSLPELRQDAEAVRCIQKLMHANPRDRPSPSEALASAWFAPLRSLFGPQRRQFANCGWKEEEFLCRHCLWLESMSRRSEERVGETQRLDGLLRDGMEALELSPKKGNHRR